jgi:transaldolase
VLGHSKRQVDDAARPTLRPPRGARKFAASTSRSAAMQFFIDTADIREIKEAASMGLVDGVTTNPTLVAKTGKKFRDILLEICDVVRGPVSAEVVSLTHDEMMKEARELSGLHENIVVKIPLIAEGLKAVKSCADEGIKTNVTLCFSATQALLAAKAGATYISPFVGRLDDVSTDGMQLISEILEIYDHYGFETQVLVASVRHPMHVHQAARMGAHVATCPLSVLLQLAKHPLTDLGLARFLEDWKKVPQ